MEASTWGSVSVAVNNTKMVFDFVDSVAINNRVNSYLLAFSKKRSKYTICVYKLKLLHNNNNSSNIHKTNTINSHAGDGYATQALGH